MILNPFKSARAIFCAALCLSLIVCDPAAARISPRQMDRLKAYKSAIRDVDGMTLEEDVRRLEISDQPEHALRMLEAIAAVYREIVAEESVSGQARKEWLHSMVALNMAYMQLSGNPNVRGDSGLNILILKKLRENLPPDTLQYLQSQKSLE